MVEDMSIPNFCFTEAVIMLQGVETAPREGGSNARLNIGVLQGGRLSRRVAVRLLTVNVDATGWFLCFPSMCNIDTYFTFKQLNKILLQ